MVRPRPTVKAHFKPLMAKPKVKGGEEHCPKNGQNHHPLSGNVYSFLGMWRQKVDTIY